MKLRTKTLLSTLALLGACRVAEPSSEPGPGEVAHAPSVEFRRYEYLDDGAAKYAVFELVNPTAETYTYQQQLGPVFFKFDLGDPHPLDGRLTCGSGIVERSVGPGGTVRVSTSVDNDVGPIQIRMSVWTPGGEEVELVSRELELEVTGSPPNGPPDARR